MGSDPPSASGRDPAAELASISSLQSSLAEYAGGVASDSKGLVVGRLAGGKLQQLLRPRFADPKLEREYRSIAYGSHRGFLCRLLLVGALLGTLLFFASLGRELYAGGSVDVIEIALRLASVAVTVAVAVFVRCSRAPTPTAVACMLWLVLLSTVGFFTNQRSAEQSGTPMRESREVLLVYLLSWGVLVPIFPLHFVSLTATVPRRPKMAARRQHPHYASHRTRNRAQPRSVPRGAEGGVPRPDGLQPRLDRRAAAGAASQQHGPRLQTVPRSSTCASGRPPRRRHSRQSRPPDGRADALSRVADWPRQTGAAQVRGAATLAPAPSSKPPRTAS